MVVSFPDSLGVGVLIRVEIGNRVSVGFVVDRQKSAIL